MTHLDPDFSILALGRQLGAIRKQEHLLDVLIIQQGTEQPHAPLDAHRLAQRHAMRAFKAIQAHSDALENLILASRPDSLADALLVAMVVSSRLARLIDTIGSEDTDREQPPLDDALRNVVRVMAREASIPLASVGGAFYASGWCDPWPDVDLSRVMSDSASDLGPCVDGSRP